MELKDAVSSLARPLLRYCLARTGQVQAAEDIAQEALTALVSRWRRLGPPESPEAFVFSIARRRAQRAQAKRLLFSPIEALAALHDDRADPQYEAELRAQLRAVRSALKHLSPSEREAILLVAAGELKLTEAALVLGISDSAMRMRVQRARKRIRTVLEPEYESA